jgi:lipoate-protein ligase A
MMQHGSILLRTSPHAPQLPGLTDLTAVMIELPELQAAIVSSLRNQTGWTFEPDDWTADERRAVAELERDKYVTPGWNEKR